MELQSAIEIAETVVRKLSPHCEIINVAGSCRRLKPVVKDIEIVCLPLLEHSADLFGNAEKPQRLGFLKAVNSLGTIIKGNAESGRYCQIMHISGIKLDLFMPAPSDYFRQFAIQTGSADYSFKVIATAWKKKGWCGTEGGLRKIQDCRKTGNVWKCVNPIAAQSPAWKSEQEFFNWLGVQWIEPKLRH